MNEIDEIREKRLNHLFAIACENRGMLQYIGTRIAMIIAEKEGTDVKDEWKLMKEYADSVARKRKEKLLNLVKKIPLQQKPPQSRQRKKK